MSAKALEKAKRSPSEERLLSVWRALSREKQDAAISLLEECRAAEDVSKRTLVKRLRALHACSRKPGGFIQLPRRPSGEREWRCEACGAIVTLDAR